MLYRSRISSFFFETIIISDLISDMMRQSEIFKRHIHIMIAKNLLLRQINKIIITYSDTCMLHLNQKLSVYPIYINLLPEKNFGFAISNKRNIDQFFIIRVKCSMKSHDSIHVSNPNDNSLKINKIKTEKIEIPKQFKCSFISSFFNILSFWRKSPNF